ncbi:AraC family transcriptional regulator [Litoreibacter roseus]|uniref:Transcriptional regulator n=1 Tax=Litoreibacter roseus TaxID=2601869 RepID=A0A6N6JJP5_9RHOB|nr:AraC family transcriptional regulator [Litoreibacter roseus]GFE66551.1 transcriptional regulator [Litoreibacter roseus]
MTETVEDLAKLVARFVRSDGVHTTPVPRLDLIRSTHQTQDLHAVHEPALCIVVRGAKRVMLADHIYDYDPANYLVVSFDLPIIGQITSASLAEPYLCIRIGIDAGVLSDLAVDMPWDDEATSKGPGLFLGETTPDIVDAAMRLVKLIESPDDIPALAKLYERELLYRIIRAPGGQAAVRSVYGPGQGKQIARVIASIKQNYREPFEMARLAKEAHLQPSALHQHFKAVTLMSPLQYHKRLRLQEARRLMLFEEKSAAQAAFAVGYESPSQFSREYRRQFGLPPMKDVEALAGSILATEPQSREAVGARPT